MKLKRKPIPKPKPKVATKPKRKSPIKAHATKGKISMPSVATGGVAPNPISDPNVKAVFDTIRAGPFSAIAGAVSPISVSGLLRQGKSGSDVVKIFNDFAGPLGPKVTTEMAGPMWEKLMHDKYGIGVGLHGMDPNAAYATPFGTTSTAVNVDTQTALQKADYEKAMALIATIHEITALGPDGKVTLGRWVPGPGQTYGG